MSNSVTATSMVEYKVVLAVPMSKMILVTMGTSTYRLPQVLISKETRHAEEITREVRNRWGLNTLVLGLFRDEDSESACAMAEVIGAKTALSDQSLRLCSVEELSGTDLSARELEQIRRVLCGNDKDSGPFARLGWLKEAQEWIRNSLSDRPVDFADEFRQYNAGDSFALVRFATRNGPAYWLKATGESNKHELAITATLSELFPQYLPPFVAKREDWNAWVTEDAGKPLGIPHSPARLARAIEALAELQMQSLDHVPRLEETGCFDQRLAVVHRHLTELIAFLEEAMGHQISTKVHPLQPLRLREIGTIVGAACLKMEELGIPSSLVNGDINLDNILYDGSRHTFIDWSEAGVGNPFLTLQQLIQHVVRDGERLDWIAELRGSYKRKWLTALTESQIDRAFVLMPLLMMISYLYGRGDWLRSPHRDEPAFQSFARTVARHMDRAASEPMLLEALQQ